MSPQELPFSNKVRIRSCGLLLERKAILLVQLYSPVSNTLVWTPPGGGVNFGETLDQCLKREFYQETHLHVEVGDLVHINELTASSYHAVECFFEVSRTGGMLQLGNDPELNEENQLLQAVEWISIRRLSEYDIVPVSLVPKLQEWESRPSFPVYT